MGYTDINKRIWIPLNLQTLHFASSSYLYQNNAYIHFEIIDGFQHSLERKISQIRVMVINFSRKFHKTKCYIQIILINVFGLMNFIDTSGAPLYCERTSTKLIKLSHIKMKHKHLFRIFFCFCVLIIDVTKAIDKYF